MTVMRKVKIVIVENDRDEQDFMEEGFHNSGLYEILSLVRNGDELFEYLENESHELPEVILSDLNMPGKNGYDIISEVRSNIRYKNIPVIITSTSSSREFIKKCMNLGASLFLVKPDTFNEYKEFAHNLFQQIQEKKLIK